jgi:hypothetical protein
MRPFDKRCGIISLSPNFMDNLKYPSHSMFGIFITFVIYKLFFYFQLNKLANSCNGFIDLSVVISNKFAFIVTSSLFVQLITSGKNLKKSFHDSALKNFLIETFTDSQFWKMFFSPNHYLLWGRRMFKLTSHENVHICYNFQPYQCL